MKDKGMHGMMCALAPCQLIWDVCLCVKQTGLETAAYKAVKRKNGGLGPGVEPGMSA
jgi:hypothetical protein